MQCSVSTWCLIAASNFLLSSTSTTASHSPFPVRKILLYHSNYPCKVPHSNIVWYTWWVSSSFPSFAPCKNRNLQHCKTLKNDILTGFKISPTASPGLSDDSHTIVPSSTFARRPWVVPGTTLLHRSSPQCSALPYDISPMPTSAHLSWWIRIWPDSLRYADLVICVGMLQ